MVVDIQQARINTPYKTISLESKVTSLSFAEFMASHKLQDEKMFFPNS